MKKKNARHLARLKTKALSPAKARKIVGGVDQQEYHNGDSGGPM